MKKLPYKLVSSATGMVGGMLAGEIFRRGWKLATGQDKAPKTMDAERRWTEVLLAAGVEGVIAALVKAVLDRGTALATAKLTGKWPEV